MRASRCARQPLTDEARRDLRELHLLTAKPVIYIANVDEAGLSADNAYLHALRARAKLEHAVVVPVCAAIEAEIAQLPEAERAEFLRDLGLKEPGLNRVIRGAYELLGLLTYFTAGPKEVRAWTVRAGSTAPQAAGVIHTDFERGFIRAEVIAFEDYVALPRRSRCERGGAAATRGQGIRRARGRRDAFSLQRMIRCRAAARKMQSIRAQL